MFYSMLLGSPDTAPYIERIRRAVPFLIRPCAMAQAESRIAHTHVRAIDASVFQGFSMPHDLIWIEHAVDDAFLNFSKKNGR